MSFKAEAPKEDPEDKQRREQAEERAEASRIGELREQARTGTALLVRRFGVRQTAASRGSAPLVPFRGGNPSLPGLGSTYAGYNPFTQFGRTINTFPGLTPGDIGSA